MMHKYLSATVFSVLALVASGFAFAGDDTGDRRADDAEGEAGLS